MQTDEGTGDTYNAARHPRFVGCNRSYVKDVCADPINVPTCGRICPTGNEVVDQSGVLCGERCDNIFEKLNGEIPRDALRLGFSSGNMWELHYTTSQIREWCEWAWLLALLLPCAPLRARSVPNAGRRR